MVSWIAHGISLPSAENSCQLSTLGIVLVALAADRNVVKKLRLKPLVLGPKNLTVGRTRLAAAMAWLHMSRYWVKLRFQKYPGPVPGSFLCKEKILL
eukprot:SAG31_NODE_816_length_11865_cov_38.805116_3_plen_97_part_00